MSVAIWILLCYESPIHSFGPFATEPVLVNVKKTCFAKDSVPLMTATE